MKKMFKLVLAALALASSTALMARNTSTTVSKFLEELGSEISNEGVLIKTADFLDKHPKTKRRLLIPIYRKRILARNLICLQSTNAFSVFLSPSQLFDAETKKEIFPAMIETNLLSDVSIHMGEGHIASLERASELANSIKMIANDIAQYVSGIGPEQRPFAGFSDADFYAKKITEAFVHQRFREFIAQLLALVDRKNYRANDHIYNLIIILLDQWNYWYQTDFYEVEMPATLDIDEALAKLTERKEIIEHMLENIIPDESSDLQQNSPTEIYDLKNAAGQNEQEPVNQTASQFNIERREIVMSFGLL